VLRVVGEDQECRAGEQAFADGTDARHACFINQRLRPIGCHPLVVVIALMLREARQDAHRVAIIERLYPLFEVHTLIS
jgi:hypothetical protein